MPWRGQNDANYTHYQQGAGSYARAVFDHEDTARAAVERMLLGAAIQRLVAEQRANGNALV